MQASGKDATSTTKKHINDKRKPIIAIGYYKHKRKVNANGTVKEVYVAKVARANIVDTDILAEEIAAICSASEGDVLMVLRSMEHVLKNHLSKGDVVKLNSVGSFSPTMRAKCVDSADKVNQFSILSTGVRFTPSSRLLEGIRDAGVRLADKRILYTAATIKELKEKDNQ